MTGCEYRWLWGIWQAYKWKEMLVEIALNLVDKNEGVASEDDSSSDIDFIMKLEVN